ncbi:MAG: ABC transporter ATP-binding protein [Ignisphaera sp.]|uniref:ABC transporter ATP-binding protein n=1 Tax=Ignisphaera aggregans TaxID=334771 RepID=A0A7C4NQC1_9CREN
MTIVKVAGISVYYENHRALNNVFFEVLLGEVVSVVGPNGSGKTTLLKTIDGILSPLKGSVYIDGKEVHKYVRRELAKIVGYVPQRIDLAAYLTVLDFVLTGRRPYALFNYSKKDLDKVMEVLKLVKAEDLTHRRLDNLSGGELQRIIIARALVAEPKVLLLDEPTANLDPKYQLEVLKLIRGLAKEKRVAVIMAIHDLTHAYRFSEKIIMLKNGNIVALGRPEDVLTAENIEKVFEVKAVVDNKLKTVVIEP